MKKYYLLLLLCLGYVTLHAQHTPVQWVVGIGPAGHNMFDFTTGTLNIQPLTGATAHFTETSAAIGNTDSSLLYYSNGVAIYNSNHVKIQNGDSLSPSPLWPDLNHGLRFYQAAVFIPYPGDSNKIYIFHYSLDSLYFPCANGTFDGGPDKLYYSVIDKTLNNGHGAVIAKNNVIQNTLLGHGIFTVKHGNGRDWWVVVRDVTQPVFYRFLISPTGIAGPFTQTIGPVACGGFNSMRYSALTNKMACFRVFYNYPNVRFIDIYDFDRCTGLYANPQTVTITHYMPGAIFSGFCEVAPGGRYLYAAIYDKLLQYDLTAANIQASAVVVDTIDSINFGINRHAYAHMQAAPDGKIYSVSGSASILMSVINNPDSAGKACNPAAGSINIPNGMNSDLPYIPLYELGSLPGSACDTLTAIAEPLPKNKLLVYPNPASNQLTIDNLQLTNKPFTVTIYDVLGKAHLIQNTNSSTFDISTLTPGLYVLHLQQGDTIYTGRFVKE
ncbi:MAG: T9SS type A sorting domain-containing protein [Bacteroidia bacterium]|nr:T9SS type A sorting domain-containing protein [Bacteroidia bacterium]